MTDQLTMIDPVVVSVFGVTNVGKSTLLKATEDIPWIGRVSVGKELRRRHPPEYYQGQAAMDHTEDEVWEIFDDQYAKAKIPGVRCVLIDGQPRMVSQIERLIERFDHFRTIWLTAPRQVLEERAQRRDRNNTAALQLSQNRLTNDYCQLFDVVAAVIQRLGMPKVISTTDDRWISKTIGYLNLVSAYIE